MSVTQDGLLHIRSPLARTVYNKMVEDTQHRAHSHDSWYSVKCERLDEALRPKFIQFTEDMETKAFLENCYEKSDWVFTQLLQSVASTVLSWFMTRTSVNGWLGRGSMFVFSKHQFRTLLSVEESWKANRLLDLGAGDGMVTKQMASHFQQVDTTELSSTMVTRLQQQGYRVLGLEEWYNPAQQYDLVSCLNLLDRCHTPVSILHHIRQALVPTTGRLLLAVVLPFSPYVEAGDKTHKPEQNLIVVGATFEEQVNSFVKMVLEPAGFIVERFTRLPYLCEGDLEHSFYVLDDAVFLLRHK